jgi:mRNA-degrading endonuclease toxin of MazEF toxin-antitoxin module
VTLRRGAVVVVELDPPSDVIGGQRFRLVCVVPVQGSQRGTPLSPSRACRSGLAKQSFVLIDQVRSINKRRVRRVFGELASEEITAIDEGLAAFLGLSDRLHGADVTPVQ